MRRALGSLAVAILTVGIALPAVGQESESDQEMEGREQSAYMNPEDGWRAKRFRVGAFGGNLTGSTSLGAVENIFFRTGFGLGSDRLQGLRISYSFAPRFEAEIEYARSSPGVDATITDLAGQGKTEFEFADYDLQYLMAVVNYSMIERSRRIVPFLSLGVGTVGLSSDSTELPDDRKPGIIFGAGLRVRIIDILALRADARGLRTGFGKGTQEEGELPGVLTGKFRGSSFTWTVGLDLRF